MQKWIWHWVSVFFLFFSSPVFAKGFLEFNTYYDTRDFSTFTLNAFAELPQRFHYFSNMNFNGAFDSSQELDLNTFYAEQNLRWALPREWPLDLTFQWVQSSGATNDLARFGFQWYPSKTKGLIEAFQKLGFIFYAINFHILQTDFDNSPGWGWQIEHAYRLIPFAKTFNKRLYFFGWLDHDMNYGGRRSDNHNFTTEQQLSIRLIDALYAAIEYRYNDTLRKRSGVGLGLEYKLVF